MNNTHPDANQAVASDLVCSISTFYIHPHRTSSTSVYSHCVSDVLTSWSLFCRASVTPRRYSHTREVLTLVIHCDGYGLSAPHSTLGVSNADYLVYVIFIKRRYKIKRRSRMVCLPFTSSSSMVVLLLSEDPWRWTQNMFFIKYDYDFLQQNISMQISSETRFFCQFMALKFWFTNI